MRLKFNLNAMLYKKISAILLSMIALSACAKGTDQKKSTTSPSPEIQQKIQKLVEKTKKNMIFVQGGSYLMGDFGLVTAELEKLIPDSMAITNPKGNTEKPDDMPYSINADNKHLHKVTLSDFKMSAYKTTVEDYNIFAQATGRPETQDTKRYDPQVWHEVATGIPWQEAHDYCQWLGTQVGIPMSLPSDAQWEYVARNRGQYVLFATDTGHVEKERNLWMLKPYYDYIERNSYQTSVLIPVLGKTPPNPLGFYDLVTNNYEWMQDWYAEDYYKHSPELNPQGPTTGTLKVLRSTAPMSADNLIFADGMTISKTSAAPKPTEKNIGTYRLYSARCVAQIK